MHTHQSRWIFAENVHYFVGEANFSWLLFCTFVLLGFSHFWCCFFFLQPGITNGLLPCLPIEKNVRDFSGEKCTSHTTVT